MKLSFIIGLILSCTSFTISACTSDADCDTSKPERCVDPPASCSGCTAKSLEVIILPIFNEIPFEHTVALGGSSHGDNNCGCTRLNLPTKTFNIDKLIFSDGYNGKDFSIDKIPSQEIKETFSYSEPNYIDPPATCVYP
ncbi:MAG: hypothetical protein CME65_01365 [Halobacteriovoraceae bacterium]|nr:hypothetical protein [Halobacteriovoraceae bacterium]|tara:strand:- start:2683 stop:3099 length:417 start_codon:yes stop_codon:yes gene_type:complete